MKITITLDFARPFTRKGAEMTREELRDIVEQAMEQSNLLNKIAAKTGDSLHDCPAWDFA